jgi:hypothetical protein
VINSSLNNYSAVKTQELVSNFTKHPAVKVKMFRIFDQKFAFVQAFPPFNPKLRKIFRRKSTPP